MHLSPWKRRDPLKCHLSEYLYNIQQEKKNVRPIIVLKFMYLKYIFYNFFLSNGRYIIIGPNPLTSPKYSTKL